MNINWDIYESERFVVKGNIGWRIIITDKHDKKEYEVQYSDLVKFRRIYDNIKPVNRDTFLLAIITSKVGKAA